MVGLAGTSVRLEVVSGGQARVVLLAHLLAASDFQRGHRALAVDLHAEPPASQARDLAKGARCRLLADLAAPEQPQSVSAARKHR